MPNLMQKVFEFLRLSNSSYYNWDGLAVSSRFSAKHQLANILPFFGEIYAI